MAKLTYRIHKDGNVTFAGATGLEVGQTCFSASAPSKRNLGKVQEQTMQLAHEHVEVTEPLKIHSVQQ